MKTNWLECNFAIIDEAADFLSEKTLKAMHEHILTPDTRIHQAVTTGNRPIGPISEDDLLKAMDKLKEVELFKKWAFIIVEDFYEDFSKMLLWPVSASICQEYQKWLTTLHWMPVYIEKKELLLNLAETLLKDKFDEVYIVSRKEIYIIDKKFFYPEFKVTPSDNNLINNWE